MKTVFTALRVELPGVAAVFLALLFVAVVTYLAAQEPKPGPAPSKPGQGPSLKSLMEETQKMDRDAVKQCGAILQYLQQARGTGDAAQMRAYVDQAYSVAAKLNRTLAESADRNQAAFTEMMRRLEQLHGGMTPEGQPQPAPAPGVR